MKVKLLAKEIKQSLNVHLDNCIQDVIVFGSHVNGKARVDSDYDILIIVTCENTWEIRRKISDLCYDIELKYNIFLDTQIISTGELEHGIRGKHPVYIDAIKDGVHA